MPNEPIVYSSLLETVIESEMCDLQCIVNKSCSGIYCPGFFHVLILGWPLWTNLINAL